MVSIIIPNYNKGFLIEETLTSVLNQEYVEWECILVDDQSTDNSIEIIQSFLKKENRFSLYVRSNDRAKGPSSCRNIGIEKAIGDYIIFLDSDDLLVDFCLKTRIETFEINYDCDFLVFQMERFVKNPSPCIKNPLEIVSNENAIDTFLRLQSLWQVTSPIYKSDFIKKINGFNEKLNSFEDIEIAIRAIFYSNKYVVFNNVDSFYRNDENYKIKYETKSQFEISLNNFESLIHSIDDIVVSKVSQKDCVNAYKKNIIKGYKKIFKTVIVNFVSDYKKQNKSILDFFVANKYLSIQEIYKFYFVHFILFKFHRVKGLGLYRFINYLYN